MTVSGTRVAQGAAIAVLLTTIAFLAPTPDRPTDRAAYEATASRLIVPDCADLHCFRVLVAWTLGSLPGPSEAKWKTFAALSNTAAAVLVGRLCLTLGLSDRVADLSVWTSAFGFGTMYTLYDPFTSDPLMYLLGPLITLLLLRSRVALAGAIGVVGVLAKEFAAVPLYVVALATAIKREWPLALRTLIAANAALIVWLVLQFWLMLRYNYGYGDSHSVQLGSGGYLMHWVTELSPRGAASALFNEYGAAWLLAPVGLVRAPSALRRLAVASLAPALLFAYVQQPDRALWNFHYLVIPAAMIAAGALPPRWAWALVACFAFANLRLGAQLRFIPAARFALAVSVAMAVVAIVRFARAPRVPSPVPTLKG